MGLFTRFGFPRKSAPFPTSRLPPMAPRQQFVPRGEAPRAQFAAMGMPSRAMNAPLATTYADIMTPPAPPAPRLGLWLDIMGRTRRQYPPLTQGTKITSKIWGGGLR